MHGHRAPHREAFSLLELVVVMGIIGLLAALLLPGVQGSREAARNAQCKSHLRQFGVASHNFADRTNEFPYYPPSAHLLGDLGYPDLQKAYNEGRRIKSYVPIAACPSDGWANLADGHLNYVMNDGSRISTRNGIHDYGRTNRGEAAVHGTPLKEVTDGLSNTALFSERLMPYTHEVTVPRAEPKRGIWFVLEEFKDGMEAEFATHCARAENRVTIEGWVADIRQVLGPSFPYKHVLPPNGYSCYSRSRPDGPDDSAAYPAPTASSQHPGGVNLLLCDGAVKFVNESIDLRVWRAIGSRDGAEPVPEF